MKNSIVRILSVLSVTLFVGTAFANDAAIEQKKHENKTPINHVAAEGIKDTNEAVAEGDLTEGQGHKLKRKHVKIEKTEQKNADLRHGLVAKEDQKKFNAKAHHVNKERAKTIEKNEEKANETTTEENKQ